MNAGVAGKVRTAGGEIYAISSEPQSLADRACASWSLDFEAIGDPHHEIAGVCRERGWLDLIVNQRLGFIESSTAAAADWSPSHPKGFFQPGVLALRADGRVLYRWRGLPTHSNMGGAMGRPTARHVWASVETALGASQEAIDAPLDEKAPLDGKGIPWPIFVSLLIANGWFLRGRGFESMQQIGLSVMRLLGFLTLWLAAFLWLPVLPPAIALALWLGYIFPKVRWLSKEFQHVPTGRRGWP